MPVNTAVAGVKGSVKRFTGYYAMLTGLTASSTIPEKPCLIL